MDAKSVEDIMKNLPEKEKELRKEQLTAESAEKIKQIEAQKAAELNKIKQLFLQK